MQKVRKKEIWGNYHEKGEKMRFWANAEKKENPFFQKKGVAALSTLYTGIENRDEKTPIQCTIDARNMSQDSTKGLCDS